MCFEDAWKEAAEGWGYRWAIHSRVEDPDVPLSPEYHQNVWIFRWWNPHLHHFGGRNRRTTISSAEEIIAYDLDKSCTHNQASLWSSQRNPFLKDYPSRYQALKYRPSRCKPSSIQNVIKLCDFGWSVYQDNKLRTTFCGTPLYVCP